MLVAPSPGLESPRDRRRYAVRYSTGLTPSTMAQIFACADLGDLAPLMELEQELTKDELIGSYLDTRLGSLSQRDVELTPDRTDDPVRAAEVKDYCEEVLSALRFLAASGAGYRDEGGLPEIVEAIDASSYFGMSLLWTSWDVLPGDATPRPVALELFDQRRYRTRPETNEVLLESAGHWMGEPITDFDPWHLMPAYGRSLSPRKEFAGMGRAVAFAWYLKSQARLYSLGYGERFAIPGVIGTFAGGSLEDIKAAFGPDALARLQLFIESFMADAAGLFPPGFKIDIVGANLGGEKLFEYLEGAAQRAIATAFFGQDGTSSGQGGSFAKAQINELSRQDLIRKGGRRVASFLRRLLGYATELRFGPGVPPAQVTFGLTPDEKADADQKRLKSAQELGLPISLDYALVALGLPEPEDGAVLLDGTTWDGEARRRKPQTLTGKDLAQAMSSGIYPLVSGLGGGIAIDVAKVSAALGVPLDPTKPPYTPPAQGSAAPAPTRTPTPEGAP